MYPLVAVLQQLAATRGLNLTNDLMYVGRASSVEERIAADLQIPFTKIQVGGLRSLSVLAQAHNLWHMAKAASVAANAIAHFKPNVVLATGGYVSAPVLWAAWRKKIPIVIDLPDLEPGWAIAATWRLSKQVAVSFDEVLRYFAAGRATVTGYPVRREFFQATRAQGRTHFHLDAVSPVVMVFGGSQGAHALNEAVRTNMGDLVRETQILHICGSRDKQQLEQARAAIEPKFAARYQVFEYLNEDMPVALAASDVIVARAGAATLGEFPAVGVPSILVPGLFAQGHQAKNADFMAGHGAALRLDEEKLATEFVPTLKNLLSDSVRLNEMRQAVRRLAAPDAARKIGELVYGYAR